jgi:hypothetical protein
MTSPGSLLPSLNAANGAIWGGDVSVLKHFSAEPANQGVLYFLFQGIALTDYNLMMLANANTVATPWAAEYAAFTAYSRGRETPGIVENFHFLCKQQWIDLSWGPKIAAQLAKHGYPGCAAAITNALIYRPAVKTAPPLRGVDGQPVHI